jgi:serine/threonine-protein kinase
MGEVYEAFDLLLGQSVALKFLPPATASDPAVLERFRNEVRIARQVSHPNVCRVYDIGEADGSAFLTMEYVDGEDLASLLRRIGRLPPDKGLEVARKLCAGLHSAHEKGVIHRDLKPANIMLDGTGQVRITDFGLAEFAERVRDTRSGTPRYMSPEQRAGRDLTARSDLYSLGIVLHEVFTGKRPGESGSKGELEEPVERVIARCLEEDPSRRPPTALSVAAALPGGDPVAAALAAGETPTPEMVAASGGSTGLSLRTGALFTLMIAAGILLYAWLGNYTLMEKQVGLPDPPAVLDHKVREILAALGYRDTTDVTASGFWLNWPFLTWVEKQYGGAAVDRLRQGHPPGIFYWWRSSAHGLMAQDRYAGFVHEEDPPPAAGSTLLRLDPHGRLFRLMVHPEASPPSTATVDWKPLLQAAGLNIDRLQSVPPEAAPPISADARAAWKGRWGDATEEIRVEAAAWRSKPVYFEIFGPWSDTPDQREALPSVASQLIFSSIAVACTVAVILLAGRNLRLGRGDLQGGLRVATIAAGLKFIGLLLGAYHQGGRQELPLLAALLAHAVLIGLTVAGIYVAFEPYVRRRFPRMLIGWSRLLEGRWKDPSVGRDVVIGVLAGVAISLLRQGEFLIEQTRGVSGSFALLAAYSGLHMQTAFLLQRNVTQLGITSVNLALFFLMRVLLKHDWLAVGAITLLLGCALGLASASPEVAVPYMLVVVALAFAALVRFGFLAFAVCFFVAVLMQDAPLAIDPSAWYNSALVLPLFLIGLLTAWGLRSATAGQSIWKDEPE